MRGEMSPKLKRLTMQRNITTWSWGVQWWFLLYWALFCHSVTGQTSLQKPSRSWHGHHLPRSHERGGGPWHQKPHIHKTYCDPSVNNHTAGDITQRCGAGFYREWSGPHKGQCVPCSCNGLSKECDEHTGNCMKCQFNTAGDQCERCKEGYHGNAALRTCRPCPCPTAWNNFALACLDVGSGVVECLCKRGYQGATCDRCASGYHGNPQVYGGNCQPCHCSDGTSNICDTLTGKCITSGANGSADHCLHDCDSCSLVLLDDLEGMDDEMAWLKKQLQNISQSAVSLTMLNRLQANISQTKVVVGRYSGAVNALLPKTEQLEADMDLVSDDLTQLADKIKKIVPESDKLVEKVNRTKVKAGDLVSEVQSLSIPIQTLLKQLSELKPGDSSTVDAEDASRMLTEVQKMLEEMRAIDCTTHTGTAANEREMARELLQQVRNNMTALVNQSSANGTAAFLMSAGSSLKDLADMLSHAQITVDRSLGLNMKSNTILHDLMKRRAQLRKERDKIPPMLGLTKDKLRNATELYGMLKESKKEAEHLAAQQDGAEMNLTTKLNRLFQVMAKVDVVIKAEDHADELDRLARELQLGLHNVTNGSSDLLNAVAGKGAHSSIISAIEEAGMAANQSRVAAEEAFKDAVQGGVVKRAEELKDNAHRMLTEVQNTPGYLQMISDQVTSHTNNIDQRKEKGRLLRNDIQHVNEDLNKIKRDETGSLVDAAKAAVSASNATINSVTVRLRTITQEVGKISLPDASPNLDGILSDADNALKSLSETLPTLNKTLAKTQNLSNQAPPAANLTESIRRIKDIIQETRTFVNRLSLATTFNGKGHVELRPPSNIEDVKAFTAVDLLLNRHPKDPSKTEGRRRRRQDKRHDSNAFVFYLGNKNSSGDYIGMAIRNNILLCVYKLGGIVHKVEASKIIMTTSVNSTDFDRVVFRRVYQDAEVNMTQNFTSPKPIHLPLKKNLPNTAIAVLDLNPDNVVFYVGGHPGDFTPPVELRYPKYRGAMKLSSVNDHCLCLFNYKSVVNLTDDQPHVKLPQSEVSDYYEGTGYRMGLTSNPDKEKSRVFKFTIKSRESNALLFYIGNDDSYFCVLVEKGHLVLQGRQAGRALKAQSSGNVSLYGTTFIIEMDIRFTVYIIYGDSGHKENISTDYVASRFRNYYTGGLPTQLRERDNITAPALRGCVDRWRVDGSPVEYNRTIGVSVGCPVALLGVHESAFKSGGSLSLDSTGLSNQRPAMVSLGFRSTEKHGAVLRTTYQDSDFQLSLTDGYIVFNYDSQALKSRNMYNDGRWHFLSAGKNDTGLELRVDNVDMGQQQPHKVKPRTHELTLAGETFEGCIANLYTRNPMSFMPADLSSSSAKGDVVLGTCNLSPHTTPLPAALLQKPKGYKMMRSQTDTTAAQCRRPSAHYGGYQLSERHSWLSYNISPEDLNYRPHFALEVRTRSSKGLLLYVAGKGDVPLVALFIANGKIKLSLGPNRIIQSNKKSNDGNWHTVVFSVEKNTFHLLVDGVRVTDGLLSNDEGSALNLKNPVYLGSYPRHKTSKSHFIPKDSVVGCIRDFRLNEILVGEPVSSHGSLPCSDVLSESGTYFGGNGGHVVLDKSFNVGSHFELTFELRPRLLTGLLFHVRGRKTSLDVYLRDNKVGVEVNDGNDVLSLLLTPQLNLCDGKFHLVAVSKQNEVLKLEVDSVREQIEGFSRSPSYSAALDSLYIGGISGKGQRNRAPVSTSFVGCLRNVKLNAKPAAFETSRVTGPVQINKCPAD